jgi:hypothetical protein
MFQLLNPHPPSSAIVFSTASRFPVSILVVFFWNIHTVARNCVISVGFGTVNFYLRINQQSSYENLLTTVHSALCTFFGVLLHNFLRRDFTTSSRFLSPTWYVPVDESPPLLSDTIHTNSIMFLCIGVFPTKHHFVSHRRSS